MRVVRIVSWCSRKVPKISHEIVVEMSMVGLRLMSIVRGADAAFWPGVVWSKIVGAGAGG